MYEIGEKVRNVYSESKRYGQIGEVVDIDDDAGRVEVEYPDGYIGGGKFSSYEPVSSRGTCKTKTTNVGILEKIADLLRTQPAKAYRKYGLVDNDGNPTSEGTRLLIRKLWDKFEEELIRAEVTKLYDEDKKKD